MKVKTRGYYPSLGNSTVEIEVTDAEHKVLVGGLGVEDEQNMGAISKLGSAVAASVERYKESESLRNEVEVNILD